MPKIFPTTTIVISGGGATANVQWGPDFGGVDGDRYNIGVQTEMPALGVFHVRQIGVGHTMPALAVLYTEQGIGINHSMSLGLSGSHGIGVSTQLVESKINFAAQGVGVQTTMPALALSHDKTIGVSPTMPKLAVDYNAQGVGIAHAMPALALDHSKSIGVQTTMPALALAHSKTVGIHLSGSVLGAPLFQDVETFESSMSSDNPVVLTKPAATVEGDFLLVFVGRNGTSIITPPSGWTEIRSDNSAGRRIISYYKFAGASEPSSYSFTCAVEAGQFGTLIRFKGVDTGTPVDVHGGQSGTETDPVAPSITTTVVNTMKICACVQANNINADYTPPANYVERSDLNGQGALGALVITGETATRVQAAAGASGSVTMNSTQALASQYASQHIALRPASLEIAA